MNNYKYLFVLSAKKVNNLLEYSKNIFEFISNNIDKDETSWLQDLTYTLQVGRESFDLRMAFTFNSSDELLKTLQLYVDNNANDTNIKVGDLSVSSYSKPMLSGESLNIFIESLISNNDLENLAVLWIQGVEIPWHKLYINKSAHRISLPTYPFSSESYWMKGYKPIVINEPSIKINNNLSAPDEDTKALNKSHEKMITNNIDFETQLQNVLIKEISIALKLKDPVKLNDSFLDMGVDSISATELTNKLNDKLNFKLSPTIFFEYRTLKDFCKYLLTHHAANVQKYLDNDYTLDTNAKNVALHELKQDKPVLNKTNDIASMWEKYDINTEEPSVKNSNIEFDFPVKLQTLKTHTGRVIEYALSGSGEVPIVLLGGILLSYRDWFFQWPILKDNFFMIIPHTPGCMGSEYREHEFSLPALATDIKEIVANLNINEPLIVIGYSFGGIIAQEFCIKYPEMTKALILCNTTDSMYNRTLNSSAILPEISTSAHAISIMRDTNVELFSIYNNSVAGFDPVDAFKNITVPILLMSSENDKYTPVSYMKSLINLAIVKHVVLKNAGHLAKSTSSDQFNTTLVSFLSSLASESNDLFALKAPVIIAKQTLEYIKEYVSSKKIGNLLMITPTGACLGLLTNYMIYQKNPDTNMPYSCAFLPSCSIAVDLSFKISRHYMKKIKPLSAGKIIVYDPFHEIEVYYNPIFSKTKTFSLVPNLLFMHKIWSTENELNSTNEYCAVLVDLRKTPYEQIKKIHEISINKNIIFIVIVSVSNYDDNRLRDFVTKPDVIIFDESVVDYQIPFAICAISERVHEPWSKVPFEGLTRIINCNYDYPMWHANQKLLSLIKSDSVDLDILPILEDIKLSQVKTIEYYARYVNSGYVDALKIYGWQWRFYDGYGCYVHYKTDKTDNKALDVFQNVGTSTRGYNPEDLISICDKHNNDVKYSTLLNELLIKETCMEKSIFCSSCFSAADLAIQMTVLYLEKFPKVLSFKGNFGFSLLSQTVSRSNIQDLSTPFYPLYEDVIFIDPLLKDAGEQIDEALKNNDINLIWIETIQYEFGGYNVIDQSLLDKINLYKQNNNCVVVVDETLTSVVTGNFLNSKHKVKNPDIVIISSCLSDSILPNGAVLTTQNFYDIASHNFPNELQFLSSGGSELLTHIGLNSIEHIKNENLINLSVDKASYFKMKLDQLVGKHSILKQVKGEGFSLALNFDLDKMPFFWKMNFCYMFWGCCLRDAVQPIVINVCPIYSDTIRFMPPLTMTIEEIGIFIESLDRSLLKGFRGIITENIQYLYNQNEERKAKFFQMQLDEVDDLL